MKQHLLSLTPQELEKWLTDEKEPKFRAGQIYDWIFRKQTFDWNLMSNLSLSARQKLAEAFSITALENVQTVDSSDLETTKYLWKLADGQLVESVLIRSDARRTVCVSSQVGCPAKCAFCASGKDGFFRNLTAGEIVEQVFQIDQIIQKKGEHVSHIVFMGMGEPLENEEEVIKSLRILTSEKLFGFSPRRITLSTVGIPEKIERFSECGIKVNLALSLHAPNQKLRQKIIPYARKYSLDAILEATFRYSEKTKRDMTFEYTLLAGINDAKEHAEELALLLKGKQCTVNLIPYNPVVGMRLNRPDKETIRTFRKVLDEKGIINTCRYTKGDDISAACGQLALQKST